MRDNPDDLIIVALIFLFVIPFAGTAQNLVPNPSFEAYRKCPYSFSTSPTDFGPTGWSSPTPGTPDYYNRCSIGDNGVPSNWAGVSYPHSGVAYAGIYGGGQGHYREYIQCKLTEPLVAHAKYVVQFHYRLSSYSNYAVDRIGLLLSETALWYKSDSHIDRTPSFTDIKDLSKMTYAWHLAASEIEARGGEQFLIIGNFHPNDSTRAIKVQYREGKSPMLATSAYFYIDDVSVTRLREWVADSIPEITTNETFILKNIEFEFNSFQLAPSSFQELDKLVVILTSHPLWKIELSGHTDDQGSDAYNLTLSRQRAKSVGDYLVQKNIDAGRIHTQGFGMRNPLTSLTTEKARALNRRVEARFLD